MYKHHEESLQIMVEYFSRKPEVIAVIFGGSVAKGCERPDSDLDAMIVIDEEAYKKRAEFNNTAETITGMSTYEGGYFDVKYMTKDFLIDAARKGSEPTRNSFVNSKVMFSKDDEIKIIISEIPVFQEKEYDEKMLSFHSNLCLNYYYFWKECPLGRYMKVHVANEIIYSIYRMILQQNRILFPSNRRLEEFVDKAENKPDNIVLLAAVFIDKMDDESCDNFVNSYLQWTSYSEPEDKSIITSTYVKDFEQWWREPRALIAEW